MTVVIMAGLVFFPVLGNLRPDWCPSCPRCGSTRATGRRRWGVRTGAEEKLNR